MTEISGNYNITAVNSSSPSEVTHYNGSIQFQFAQLQLELAQANKNSALQKIDGIREEQDASAAYTQAINDLRAFEQIDYDPEVQGEIPTTLDEVNAELEKAQYALDAFEAMVDPNLPEGECKEVSQDVQDYVNSIKTPDGQTPDGLAPALTTGDNLHTQAEISSTIDFLNDRIEALEAAQKLLSNPSISTICADSSVDFSNGFGPEQIDIYISSLESAQEEIGSDIQQEMVFVQDYMGQYNAYTQGANSAISEANDTLKTVAGR